MIRIASIAIVMEAIMEIKTKVHLQHRRKNEDSFLFGLSLM
jgi:hypothetical protein